MSLPPTHSHLDCLPRASSSITIHQSQDNIMSPHQNHTQTKTTSRLITTLATTVALSMVMSGCQPSSDRHNDDSNTQLSAKAQADQVIIGEDSVTITQDHLLNIKFKRYQPSLGLNGTTFSSDLTTLTSPAPLAIDSILVDPGQWVKQGDPLIRVVVIDADTGDKSAAATDTATSHPSNGDTGNTSSSPVSNRSAAKDAQDNAANIENNNNKAAESSASKPDPTSAPLTMSDKPAKVATLPSRYKRGQILIIKAPFSGQIDHLYVSKGNQIAANLPLIKLSNPHKLKFIGSLPIEAKPQLSIGQNVNFSVEGISGSFTGQLSKMTPAKNPNQMFVHVDIISTEENKDLLTSGMSVAGRIDYGQIEVGTTVPKAGIHDADLSALSRPPYRAKVPIKANVWIIQQDQRLARQQVEVIEYDPATEQYLVVGISNDSLICLAPLPAESAGKKVIVS